VSSDFDVIIVGSGPAGVSAAFPLVESGLHVLMVDGGRHATMSPPTQAFLSARTQDPNQWKWMIGENFHALRKHDVVSPKLRVPAHAYVFEKFEIANRIDAQGFVAVGSLASGGLSNAWGCGVARLSKVELSGFPFRASSIERSYEAVARRIGVSGRQEDDLSDYFGLDAWSQPAIKMDSLHSYLYERYIERRTSLASLRFRLGRSRVAVLCEDLAERKACDNSGNCLWGCHRGAMYSANDELPMLRRYENFHYEKGFVVEGIVRYGNYWSVEGQNERDLGRRSISACKIVLAAGTLATTRLALQALRLTKPARLLSCPTAAFLIWLPRKLGAAIAPAFGLGQLSFELAMEDGISGFGSTFGTIGIPVSEFVRHLPLRRRYGIDLLRGLLSSCLVGNLFLPGHLSAAEATLRDDGSLRIEGGYSDRVPSLMDKAADRLRKAYWRLGAILLPMSFTVGRPGGDIHYAGTLPMQERPTLGETNALGELYGLEGVHVVDGASLPTLTEKSHTLTIMANADRIGREVASMKFQEV
jgi:choline dehydrogenase-like flavoprotein